MDDKDIPKHALSEWQPVTDKYILAILGKAGEELCEAGSAIFRCIIQGIHESEPVTKKLNKEWLEDEIADVRAMLEHVEDRLNLDNERITKRTNVKFAWKATWFDSLKG